MNEIYLLILIFLLSLAIFDLTVGVANDAVNFLGPAVGAKAAKFRTVLIVAAIGILIGASTSSGMMDISRNGILQPSFYTFAEVMCVFLAVSATDIIIMDIFNTLGLPTSTTVSMVFGLFGGSTALAVSKLWSGTYTFGQLIHTEKALQVIMAIFLSVAIAFVFGFIVMWFVRTIFTFEYKKHLRYSIALYGGIGLTSIFYFLLVNGLKGSHLLSDLGIEQSFINEHQLTIVGSAFVTFTILMQILHWCHVNIFRVVVIFGTFALAMAFAGNDLVNFIGVPLAGLESYVSFINSGATDPDTYLMFVLNGSSQLPGGPTFYLIAAGIIMTTALFTSKKAHKVVETAINLSRQDESDQVFSSSKLARQTVRGALNVTATITRVIPFGFKSWVGRRFNAENAEVGDGVAFDLVRASVNLVLAGLLIAVGTTLKLPLSTTYVAFMVAMGSSLADRAWGRESAVYRITGVISVVGGWFITAGAAFLISFLIATLNHIGGIFAMIAVIGIVILVVWNNNRSFKKKKEEEKIDLIFRQLVQAKDKHEVWTLLSEHVATTQVEVLTAARSSFKNITNGLMHDNIRLLRGATSDIADTKAFWKRYRSKEVVGMRRLDYLQAVEKNTWFHLGANNCSQIIYSLRRMLDPISEHVDNNFNPMPAEYISQFTPVCKEVDKLFEVTINMISTKDFSTSDEVLVNANALKSRISEMRHAMMEVMRHKDSNIRVAMLYLSTLQETQELISDIRHLLRAAKRFQN